MGVCRDSSHGGKQANYSSSLSKGRKKRPVPDGWVTPSEVSTFEVEATTALPVAQTTSLDTEGGYAAIGGLKGQAAIYSIEADKLEREVAVGEPATSTLWTGSKLLFGTSQGAIKVFEGGNEVATLSEHSGAATGLSMHPSGDLVASVGADKGLILYDLKSLKRVSRAYADAGKFLMDSRGAVDFEEALTACSSDCVRIPPRWTPCRGRYRYRRREAVHDQDSGAGCRLPARSASPGPYILREWILAGGDGQGADLGHGFRPAKGRRRRDGQGAGDGRRCPVSCLGLYRPVSGDGRPFGSHHPAVRQGRQEVGGAIPQLDCGCQCTMGTFGQEAAVCQRRRRRQRCWPQGIEDWACFNRAMELNFLLQSGLA